MSTEELLKETKQRLGKLGVGVVAALTVAGTEVSAQNVVNNEVKKEARATSSYNFQSSINQVSRALIPHMDSKTPTNKVMTGTNSKGEEISYTIQKVDGINNPVATLKDGDTYYISNNGFTFSYNTKTDQIGATLNRDTDYKGKTYVRRDKKGNVRPDGITLYNSEGTRLDVVDGNKSKDIINGVILKAIDAHDNTVKTSKENGSLKSKTMSAEQFLVMANKLSGNSK